MSERQQPSKHRSRETDRCRHAKSLPEMEKIDVREKDCVYNGHLPDVAQLLWRPTQAHGCDVNGFLMPANSSGT